MLKYCVLSRRRRSLRRLQFIGGYGENPVDAPFLIPREIFVFFAVNLSYKRLLSFHQTEMFRWPKNQNVGLGRRLTCAP